MLSHVENRYQPSFTPWKPHIHSKTVVFVGDTNGVGHTTAVMLAAHGAPVFLSARSTAALKQAFMEINGAGGECDGMVVDWSRAEEWRRFFMMAEAWLGGIDAVITPPANDGSTDQNQCMQEAIQHMQMPGYGRLININLPHKGGLQNRTEQRTASMLRRQAREMGFHVTLIEMEDGWRSEPDTPNAQDIARCVLESLAQPFGADVVRVQGQMKPTY